MTGRTRRTVLGLCAGLLGTASGCLGGDREHREGSGGDATPPASPGRDTDDAGSTDPATRSFDHAEKLGEVDADFPQRTVGPYYLGLLTAGAHAEAFPTVRFQNRAAAEFVAETDFSSAAVIVFQDRRSSSHPDLELQGASVDDDTVWVRVRYPGSGGTADVTTDTLLVRVQTGGKSPRAARTTVTPQHGEPVSLGTSTLYDDVATFEEAGDFVVENRDCEAVRASVTVTYRDDLFRRDRIELPPASAETFPDVIDRPGEWGFSVRIGERAVARTWSPTEEPPGDVVAGVSGDGTLSLSRRPDGVANVVPERCETGGYPYESQNPAENVEDPVDLWILDRAEAERRLTVTIRDGDREVFSEEFQTGTGYDKIRRSDLLAKRTTYAVVVTASDGSSVTESVSLGSGDRKLVVRISEAGSLSVSLE